jgi:FlaA1/EpsC-like NDP-sugar epimerase
MSQLDRSESTAMQVLLDGMAIAISFVAALTIYGGEANPGWFSPRLLFAISILLGIRIATNLTLGVYRCFWKFISLSDVIVVSRSVLTGTLILFLGQWLIAFDIIHAPSIRFPSAILVLEFFLSLSASLFLRAGYKLLYERAERPTRGSAKEPRRIALYGAGRAGMLLYKELKGNPDFEVVGFLDDDPDKRDTVIIGLRVLGNRQHLGEIVQEHRIQEIVISVASGDPRSLAEILSVCKKLSLPVKIIPSLEEIVDDHARIAQLREVQVEDLLGRERTSIACVDQNIRSAYERRRILVTGAGGSIGSELVRQLLCLRPERVALVDKDENAIYELEQEVLLRFPNLTIVPIVADVRNHNRLNAVFGDFRPDWVFHAAAHKHVPLMERHPCEAVLNNVAGTLAVLEACRAFAVERFVFISSDKAVNPTSVMGATKRIGELLTRAYAQDGKPIAASVRFGNVAGSRGSVIPVFKKQIANGGPLTITHPEMVRYFMTIPEAVQLVLCAGTLGAEGEVFVLDMGNPRSVLEMAKNMILLSGMQPERDIPILVTGMRPGEKLYEELTTREERLVSTTVERVSRVEADPSNLSFALNSVERLIFAAERNDREQVSSLLVQLCAGYHPLGEPRGGIPESLIWK